MNIFDQYGIKEVADVTLYSIHRKKDGSGEVYYVPALYLDTLKISTAEKTAENVWAQGGLGNSRLICWDYGKQINVNLEDALCTPASLGLCWNGTLSADWKDAQLQYNTDVCYCINPLTKISRLESVLYPGQNTDHETISSLLPKLDSDTVNMDLLGKSSVVDGTLIKGHGLVAGHVYGWKMDIETAVKSIAVVPDKFFDVKGRSYPIDQSRKVSVADLPTYSNYKSAIIYKINSQSEISAPHAQIIYDQTNDIDSAEPEQNVVTENGEPSTLVTSTYNQNRAMTSLFAVVEVDEEKVLKINVHNGLGGVTSIEDILEQKEICEAQYLAIIVDNNNNYYALIGIDSVVQPANANEEVDEDIDYTQNAAYDDTTTKIIWYQAHTPVNVTQFEGIDMWLKFDGINALTYFLLTKYNDDIQSIIPTTIDCHDTDTTWGGGGTGAECAVNKQVTDTQDDTSQSAKKSVGKLWAYINPRTMQPYTDDYWFHQGEPYYIKSLTMAPKGKRIKGNKITVRADQWPGMYMMVGETYIRSRETGEDERMQIKFPLCKVKSDHTLTLQADGDPTTFNLQLEVARPKSGIMMELTAYEIAQKMLEGENGCFYAVDGSTEVLSE